jgi:hypothetical protein
MTGAKPGRRTGSQWTRARNEQGFAPEIEYSWNSKIGVLPGRRAIAAGHNTSATITPAIATDVVCQDSASNFRLAVAPSPAASRFPQFQPMVRKANVTLRLLALLLRITAGTSEDSVPTCPRACLQTSRPCPRAIRRLPPS